MLSEGDEERLLFLLETDYSRTANGMIINPRAYAITYLWLAEKLKEINDENKELANALGDVSTKFATLSSKVVKLSELSGYDLDDLEYVENWKALPKEKIIMEQLQTDLIHEVYKNPKNEISDRFYPRD